MEPINIASVQEKLETYVEKQVYVHLETTTGMYAGLINEGAFTVGAFIRNAKVTFTNAKVVQAGPVFRVGLKMDLGWIYAEGLTDWTIHNGEQLLLAGHDSEGRLMVSLQISEQPFKN